MRDRRFVVMAFFVALCSMVYELLLAQALTSLLGNTLLRYSITIGFYIFALGLGALWVDLRPPPDPYRQLIRVEVFLSVLGLACVPLAFLWDAVAQLVASGAAVSMTHILPSTVNQIGLYGLIVVIGVASGFEIPLLTACTKSGERAETAVLAVDYIGTFAGAILFPLVLYPFLGLVATAALTAMLNAGVALVLVLGAPADGNRSVALKQQILPTAVLIVAFAMLAGEAVVRAWISQNLLLLSVPTGAGT